MNLPCHLPPSTTRVNGSYAVIHLQVSVGRDTTAGRLPHDRQKKRILGISLLGACTSKGCPTKSDENEDRYVHVSGLKKTTRHFFSQVLKQ